MLEVAGARIRLRHTGLIAPERRDARRPLLASNAALAPFVTLDGTTRPDARLDLSRVEEADPRLVAGPGGRAIVVHGRDDARGIEKTLRLELPAERGGMVVFQGIWRNVGPRPVHLGRIAVQRWRLSGRVTQSPVWAFLGASRHPREEAVLALEPGLERENRMGEMTPKGRGGGLPLVAFWSRDGGVALGLAETTPRVFSLPLRVNADGTAELSLVIRPHRRLAPGEEYRSPALFASAFRGDFYEALVGWRRLLEGRGLTLPAPPPGAYEASWCSWGFGRRVTPSEILGALPKVTDLGLTWATLDDGWFAVQGDAEPRADFGVGGIRRVVRAFHERGVRVQLWWLPLAVEDGALRPSGRRRKVAKVVREHPDWRILDARGEPVHTFGQYALLCPTLPAVKEYYRTLTRRFIAEWDLDGLKIDKVFSVPRCYNPAHHHRSPDEPVERLGELLQAIHDEVRRLKPEAVVQICPCATLPNLAWLGAMNQPVTSDPDGSAQVRWRTKVLKAVFGPSAPVSADHVELTASRWEGARQLTLGWDFASALGVGAVPATRFVWPPERGHEDVNLTGDKEAHWRRWLKLYEERRLAEGRYRNLYVHGFDRPEAYVIEKDGCLHFAFYADGGPATSRGFDGTLELRGLEARRYRLHDDVDDRDLGVAEGPTGRLTASFSRRLLLRACPE
jgi:alpha-galactosidase